MNPATSPASFASRHIGPREADLAAMLDTIGLRTLEALAGSVVPNDIRLEDGAELQLPPARQESEVLEDLAELAGRNRVMRSLIGMGYADCITPPVIQRNLLEDPRWYTPYTPYQSEVSQGRLEALLNFQTMVCDLTGMEISNASMLDEPTAAAEALAMCWGARGERNLGYFVSEDCHPQTIGVVRTRAEALGIQVTVGSAAQITDRTAFAGVLLAYPSTDGSLPDISSVADRAHDLGSLVVVAADLLALALLKPPGELGADIVVGSAQRFGVPMGYGGPHAGFLAARKQLERRLPGRLVGVSRDAEGAIGYRLALQTREQHIRRDRATSNICTAQVLLAIASAMYASYHGPEGLRAMAGRVHQHALHLAGSLLGAGWKLGSRAFFDTIRVNGTEAALDLAMLRAHAQGINLRRLSPTSVTIALDERTTEEEVCQVAEAFGEGDAPPEDGGLGIPRALLRTTEFLTHPVFHKYRSETEMMRYLNRLQNKDLSLADSMIPLGSCTMKLNAAAEMMPISFPGFARLHPYAPADQAQGYAELLHRLERMLLEITGFDAVSLQPNAGSQGEYAGLLAIRGYHRSRAEGHRNVCLIPKSAHGTNPATAAMTGMTIVAVECDSAGNVDLDDLRSKAEAHSADLACLMITYPSTHGVFEESIREICSIVHRCGGQVYMDGANMNAQVGLCRPGDFGADVCHLNLHKTFCIPHGGGGPGMGPICVRKRLEPFLPSNPAGSLAPGAVGPVSAAPHGSASILPISYAYITLMGSDGLRRASLMAILNANYVAKRLETHFPVLYRGATGFVAHECIVDLRPVKATSGVEVEDVAKRLMDYGFHAPTVSFPVPGTMMIEPTESESKEELDRFCEAMIAIRGEIGEIEQGRAHRTDNLLKNAPHTARAIASDLWTHPYSRERAAFPLPRLHEGKYWPPVARVDNAYGDRNVVCSCPPIEDLTCGD